MADSAQLAADAELARLRSELASCRNRYKAALSQIDRERERADNLVSLQGIKPAKRALTKTVKAKKHSATMVVLLSDIHCEETVRPETVNGLNAYDLKVCEARLTELQERFFTMLAHERTLCDIDRVVVWMGGDLISGMIHPELAEENSLHPLAAIRWVGERLRGFVDAVADNAREVVVATSCGNHGRTTEKLRTNEADTSYEHHLYLTMRAAETKQNVKWQVGEGHLNYVDLDGFRVRFCHGHAIRYQGGIGGLTVPLTKWQLRQDQGIAADHSFFGHFHQLTMGTGWSVNGSLIGPTAYGLKLGFAPERPQQLLRFLDSERGWTGAFPVLTD
jgi:hypothetical protein